KPLIDDCELDDPCRFGKSLFRRLRVASLGFEGEISRPIVPYLRGAGLERGDGTDDMRQCLPVNLQCLCGVLCRIDAVSHHEGDRIADMPHDILRQDWIVRHLDIDVRYNARCRQGAERGDVGSGQNQTDARHFTNMLKIDDAKSRVRMRRAHHHGMKWPFRTNIGNVTSCPAQERIIFLALEWLAEAELHGHEGSPNLWTGLLCHFAALAFACEA